MAQSAPLEAKTRLQPTFSVTLKRAFLSDLVVAAAPFETTQTYEVGALGITRDVSYKVRFTDPSVEIADGKIIVPLKFHAADGGGLLSTTGDARPELALVYNDKTQGFEARLTKANLSLGALGLTVGVEELIKPIPIPGVVPADIELGDKTLTAHVSVVDIVVGKDDVRIDGHVLFKPVVPEKKAR